MLNMSKDLRIEKTEVAIEQAFLELIEEKGYANIHLVDIAKRANVNRNTIYIRYGTKEDIITSIVAKSFQKKFDEIDIDLIPKTVISKRIVDKFFTSMFETLADEMDLYRIILTDQNLSGYIERKLRDIRKLVSAYCEDTKKNTIIVNYIVQGVYGVVKSWIIYDTGSIEDNVKILSNLVMSNARRLTR